MDLGIEGKRAAVAAGSAGLGLGTARALMDAGVHVAICGRDPQRLSEAAESLGEGAHPLVADVSTVEGATRFVEEARNSLGGLDILVTNAGGPPPGNFASTDLAAYPAALSLNLLSVVAMCKAALPGMQSQGWGRILAITSITVRQPIDNLILSNTARAGATGFLKTLANQVAPHGVTVNSIQPGLHRTARLGALDAGATEALAAGIPTRTLGEAEHFGMVAAFLCSDPARFINGAAIPVDGGAYPGLL
ncbi:MAG TPA: SDR family oxidoreductase [Myxococcales bacterium]|nr:SDR family oxidoreductase [Myxococcales bacterium]